MGRAADSLGLALLPVSILLLFFDLGARVLSTNDETRFPLLARDILARGDWLLPHLNGSVYLNKPPLYAWLVALASWPGGAVTQSTAALPSLLAALGVVVLTSWIARRLLDPGAGLGAGLIAVTMYGVFTLARVPMPDMTLCFALTGAMAAFVAAEFGRRRAALLAFYALVAVAFWAKGPAGLLPIAIALLYALATHGRSGWRGAVSASGLLLLLLSIAAWGLLGLGAGQQAFTEGVVRTDMLGWYLRSGGMSWRALTEPFAQTATVLLPWTIVLPLAIWGALRAQPTDPEQSRPARFLLIWAGVVFVAIGASLQQRMRYYLPLCPPVAILIAAWCARLPLRRRRAVFAGVWVVVAAGLVAWQAAAGARHNAATDLRGVAREVRRAPAPLYAVETPELVFAFYLAAPVVLLRGDRPLEQYLADARDGYLVIANRMLPSTDGAALARPVVADGIVGGRRFSVFAKE